MSNRFIKGSLLASTVIAGMAIAAPAYAQTSTSAKRAAQNADPAVKPTTDSVTTPDKAGEGETIIVTGSFLRRTTIETRF